MAKKLTTTEPKAPKVIKVSTIVIAVTVLLGLIAAFIGGIVYNENYNNTVQALVVEQVELLKQSQK